jgi:oxidase EvaA
MIVLVENDIEVLPNFKWMTLGQIKELMRHDNLVNMDTRTVLSGIPFATTTPSAAELKRIEAKFSDKSMFNSLFKSSASGIPALYQSINDYKMFRDIKRVMVPLNQLVDWTVDNYGITSHKEADFDVRYYNIEISGREVRHWTQPLFRALGEATFVLLTRRHDGVREFLVKATPEIGAFDRVEIGPSAQWEPTHHHASDDAIEQLAFAKLNANAATLCDVVLSEEGGRFYHEQNRNVVLEVENDEVPELPGG